MLSSSVGVIEAMEDKLYGEDEISVKDFLKALTANLKSEDHDLVLHGLHRPAPSWKRGIAALYSLSSPIFARATEDSGYHQDIPAFPLAAFVP